ncbi:5-hydroxytryptamine receptor-like [Centruroides vittatus]|uniref:5-hydroxytryptamine receptor-like n=1 Tax=Centruroides vittatus TaxID=120091 RepID=UPI00350F50CF
MIIQAEDEKYNFTSGHILLFKNNHNVTTIVISIILGLLILATIIGNIFVISAVLIDKNLRTVRNYLVLSLATADLMVACLVMPLSAVNEVNQEWTLGPALCDIWTFCDVLCCTASILHLLSIAVDRYWSVTNMDYARQRNACQIYLMILFVWITAIVISVAPVFGWKDPDFKKRLEEDKKCLVSQDLAYQIFATFSSFFVPLIIILILYWRIYQVARNRIRRNPRNKAMFLIKLQSNKQITECEINNKFGKLLILAKRENKKCKETSDFKREKKAAKTLAIITGVFVICWFPFFVMALVMPICRSCQPNDYIFSFLLWLGYANSMLNPIIYTIFSPDFRQAFKRLFRLT